MISTYNHLTSRPGAAIHGGGPPPALLLDDGEGAGLGLGLGVAAEERDEGRDPLRDLPAAGGAHHGEVRLVAAPAGQRRAHGHLLAAARGGGGPRHAPSPAPAAVEAADADVAADPGDGRVSRITWPHVSRVSMLHVAPTCVRCVRVCESAGEDLLLLRRHARSC